MNKEELIEFLKNNLEIKVESDYDIKVSLILCGEVISADFVSLPE